MNHVVFLLNALEREQSSQWDSIIITESGQAETKMFKTIVSQTHGYTELNAAFETTVFRKARSLFRWPIIVSSRVSLSLQTKRTQNCIIAITHQDLIKKKKMRQKHIYIIMMNSEEEFGINQFDRCRSI